MKKTSHRPIIRWLFSSLIIAVTLLAPISSTVHAAPPPPIPDEFEEASAVDILLPDRKALNYLVTNGFDLDHNVAQTENGIKVTIIATPSELNFLESLGFVNLGTTFSQED